MTLEAARMVEQRMTNRGASHVGRPSPVMQNLTVDQRAELWLWLSDDALSVARAISRARAEWGAQLSESSVSHFRTTRKAEHSRSNLHECAEEAKELLMSRSDAETVEEAAVAMLIRRSLEVINAEKLSPALVREVMGLVVRLREQKIQAARLDLERRRFELDVAEMTMKHLEALKESGVLQIEDRGEAVRKLREELFGRYRPEQSEADSLRVC